MQAYLDRTGLGKIYNAGYHHAASLMFVFSCLLCALYYVVLT
jgi:hypothetical protein